MNMDMIRNAVAEAAKQFGAEEYELTITDKENTGVEALKKEISSVSYSRTGSMVVRCVVGGKSGYAASELVTPEAAAEIVETACDNAGIVDDVALLDLQYSEDSRAQVDLNCVMNEMGEIIELQGTGEGRAFTLNEQQELVRLCAKGCKELLAVQKAALKK